MKIGILTHYYGSNNYGGVLQAYALTKVLRDMGYDAEQICFPYYQSAKLSTQSIQPEVSMEPHSDAVSVIEKQECLPIRVLRRVYRSVRYRTIGQIEERKQQKILEIEKERKKRIEVNFFSPRCESFRQFRASIPHSSKVYEANAMFMANNDYDAFITGSDQVWNFLWYTRPFFLEFADTNKKKIAYAASAGNTSFDELQKKYLRRVLPKYDAISVREQDLVETYRNIAGVESDWVLDPVLLLDQGDWNELASDKLIHEPYLFCFFYNPTECAYKLVEKYAMEHKLKIVTIPYAVMSLDVQLDDTFGDYRLGTASPEDFLSLVRYAECVITDSFHGNVFSILYGRPFYTLGRDGMEQMNSRIASLTDMFHCKERFCDDNSKQTIEYMNKIAEYSYCKDSYMEMKEKSLLFLMKHLNS